MSLATRTTVERALAAYLQTVTFDGKTLADFPGTFAGDSATPVPLSVHCICGEVGENGEIPAEWGVLRMPAIVIACPRSQPHLIGYDECSVAITAITTPDEINAPAQVQARAGWLSALFDEDNLDLIRDALNAPESGEDTRPVKGIHVVGMMRDGEDHQENGHQVFSAVKLLVSATGIPEP